MKARRVRLHAAAADDVLPRRSHQDVLDDGDLVGPAGTEQRGGHIECDDGLRLHVQRDRADHDALTYVFVHGIASSVQEFREQRAALTGRVNMVFYDQRIVLVAHSLGGMVGLTLLSQNPELLTTKIAGVALISTTAARIPEVATPHSMAVVLMRRSRRLVHRIGAGAQLLLVPGAGHTVNQTHADIVNDALYELSIRLARATP